MLSVDLVNQITEQTHCCGSITSALVVRTEWTIKTGQWWHFLRCYVRTITQAYVRIQSVKPWLRVKYDYFETILKLFQCFFHM